MAPDLNSLGQASTVSPTTSRSRRASQHQITSPNLPLASPTLNILPSNQSAVNHISPLASPSLPPVALAHTQDATTLAADSSAAGGPGPLRHPRPLTHAELHLQLEKEQEAVVCDTHFDRVLRYASNMSVG